MHHWGDVSCVTVRSQLRCQPLCWDNADIVPSLSWSDTDTVWSHQARLDAAKTQDWYGSESQVLFSLMSFNPPVYKKSINLS